MMMFSQALIRSAERFAVSILHGNALVIGERHHVDPINFGVSPRQG
jgi:hypothetical protein